MTIDRRFQDRRRVIFPALLLAVLAAVGMATPSVSAAVPAFDGGRDHTVALREDGTVWTWGRGERGILGDGRDRSDARSLVPIRVETDLNADPFEDVIAVASGIYHSIALKGDGTVWAWGWNWYGELGYGEVGIDAYSTRPGQVQGLPSNVVAIASGANHNLALTANGTVWAWGRNHRGQLGDGAPSNEPNTVPVQVVDPIDPTDFLTGVEKIAAGAAHSVALKDDGTVWTWGSNQFGQLGDGGANEEYSSVPVQVVDGSDTTGYLSELSAIAAGGNFTMALKHAGSVWAWGHNTLGQLGNGTGGTSGALSATPVQVKGVGGPGHLEGVSAISAGFEYALALANDDTVFAWGSNERGELGDGQGGSGTPPGQGDFGDHSTTPVKVLDGDGGGELVDVLAVHAGNRQNMAVKYDGTVRSWGENGDGELGDNSQTDRLTPVQVHNLNVDTTAPAVTFSPEEGAYAPPFNVTLQAEDTVDPSPTIYYTTDGSAPDTDSPSFPGSGEVPITQPTTLQFYAVDGAGHESAVQTAEYLMAPTAVAQIPDEGSPVFPEQSVTLDGTGSSDPDDDPLTYAWTIDATPPDSESAQLEDADQATATFTPDVWGEYVLGLTVDDGRDGTDTDTVTVMVHTRPSAGFDFESTDGDPDQLLIDTPVQFTDESDDPDSQGTRDGWTWSWDFGDGATSGEQHPTHIYTSAGVYHVTLQVVDQDGYASETASHRVLAVGTPGAPVTKFQSWLTDPGGHMIDASAEYGIVFSKIGDGSPRVTLAEYGGNPTDVAVFDAGSRFFDVNLYPTDEVDEVTLTVTLGPDADPTRDGLAWFDPGGGTWKLVEPQTLSGNDADGYTIDVTLNRTKSSPTVQQLTGTIFGVGPTDLPVVKLLSPQSGNRWNGIRDITWETSVLGVDGGPVTIDLAYAPAGAGSGGWRAIAEGEVDDGAYTWDTSQVPQNGVYEVRLTATGELGSEATVTSDAFFISRAQGVTAGPNPARDHVTFYFGPDVNGTLYVYDAAGRLVWQKNVAAGTIDLRWNLTDRDGHPLANGLYLYRLVGDDGDGSEIGKLVIVR